MSLSLQQLLIVVVVGGQIGLRAVRVLRRRGRSDGAQHATSERERESSNTSNSNSQHALAQRLGLAGVVDVVSKYLVQHAVLQHQQDVSGVALEQHVVKS